MKRGAVRLGWQPFWRPGLGVALLTGLLGAPGTQAGAQDVGSYRAVARELDAAAQTAGQDKLATLNHLDAAQKALDTLTPTISNPALRTGLSDGLSDIRAAQSRTAADLQAQVLLERGLMRKALYDQTMSDLGSGGLDSGGLDSGSAQGTTSERLGMLAQEFKLGDPAPLLADARAGQAPRVAWRLQKAAVSRLSSALDGVEARKSAASYLNLARATAWFAVVQGADGADTGLTTRQFEQAMSQLVAGQNAALGQTLAALRSGTRKLSLSLVQAPMQASQGQGAQQGVTRPTQSQSAQTRPASPPKSAGSSRPAVATVRAGATDTAYAALGRALAASSHADLPRARQQISLALRALHAAPLDLQRTGQYPALVQQLGALQTRKALTPADVQAAIAGLSNAEAQVAGRPVSALDSSALGTTRSLGGWRTLLSLLLALACAAPLYLVYLAFGNTSRSWRFIRVGLLLALLPLMLAGVLGTLAWLGDLAGLGPVRALQNLVPGQAPGLWPLWWLLSALGVGLLAYGFRGLCVQFGLLGSRESRAAPRPAAAERSVAQTSVDWDEE